MSVCRLGGQGLGNTEQNVRVRVEAGPEFCPEQVE